MSCCGKKRDGLRQAAKLSVTQANAPKALQNKSAMLLYRGQSSVLVTGLYSGQVYRFSAKLPEMLVHAADAEVLLRTGLFTQR